MTTVVPENPYAAPTIVEGGDRGELRRRVIALGCFAIVAILVIGPLVLYLLDWRESGLELGSFVIGELRSMNWLLAFVLIMNVIGQFGMGQGILAQNQRLTVLSLVPVLLTVSGLTLLAMF